MSRSEAMWPSKNSLPVQGFTVPSQAEVYVLSFMHGILEAGLKSRSPRLPRRAELLGTRDGMAPVCFQPSRCALCTHQSLSVPSDSSDPFHHQALPLTCFAFSECNSNSPHSFKTQQDVLGSSTSLITPDMERCTPEGKGAGVCRAGTCVGYL